MFKFKFNIECSFGGENKDKQEKEEKELEEELEGEELEEERDELYRKHKRQGGLLDFVRKLVLVDEQPDRISEFDEEDISSNKTKAALSYCYILSPIMPLFDEKSRYLKFHSSQGVTLLLWSIITILFHSIALEIVSMFNFSEVVDDLLSIIVSLPFIALYAMALLLAYCGFRYAKNGVAKELPAVSKLRQIPNRFQSKKEL